MRRVVAFAFVLVFLGAASARAEPRALTKLEARTLPTAELKRRVMEQLAAVLIEAPRPRSTRSPKQPLTDLWFSTKSRAASQGGLCTYDQIVVGFAPVTSRDLGARTPVHANSLSTQAYFRLLKPATVVDDADGPSQGDEAACRRLSTAGDGWFAAHDSRVALEGALHLSVLDTAAATPSVRFDCHWVKAAPEGACRRALAALSLHNVSQINDCGSDDSGNSCWSVMAWIPDGHYFELRLYGPFGQAKLARVTAAEEVIVADERED